MKKYVCSVCTLLAVSCSAPSPQEQVERLAGSKGEWTNDQTEMAVDLYLDGLSREEELLDRNLEVREGIRFFDERRCSRDVLRERRAEIDSARARLDAKRARILQISR